MRTIILRHKQPQPQVESDNGESTWCQDRPDSFLVPNNGMLRNHVILEDIWFGEAEDSS
jgi:hypothetical protein